MIIISLTQMTLAGVFTVKAALVATAVAFNFTRSHIFTPTHGAALALVTYLAVCLCDCAHTLNPVILDTSPLDAACIFYESGERWKLCPSLSVCRSQGQRKLPASALMFGGLITSAQLLG